MPPRHTPPTLDCIAQQLLSTQREAPRDLTLTDPLSDTPIRVSLEQLRPYDTTRAPCAIRSTTS